MIAISQPAVSESLVICYSIDLNGFDSYRLDSGTTMADLPSGIVNYELLLIYSVTGRKKKHATYIVQYCRVLQSCMFQHFFIIGKHFWQ